MDDDPITDAEQARAAALMHATEDVVAPASLHAAVHAMTSSAGRSRRRAGWPRWTLAPGAAVLAAVIVALVLVLGGGSGAPTVSETSHLALAPATSGPPAQDVADRSLLDTRQSGIPFPSYRSEYGWAATGQRHDTLHGRQVTTVFYTSPQGTRIGYSIVSGQVLADPRGATPTTSHDIRYFVTSSRTARTVSWWRDGHTCVISSRSASAATLLSLARADEQAA